jgi:CubicO group peptidase (beta-lactamase class C family)
MNPEISILANRTFDLMFDIARVEPGTKVWHLPVQSHPLDFSYQVDGKKIPAREFAERTYTDALLILKHGKIIHEKYFNRANENTHFISYSMAKSFNSIMAGIALGEGKLASTNVQITKYMPELKDTAYDGLTLKHLLQMRTGAPYNDDFFVPGLARDAHVAAFVDNAERFVTAAQKITERTGPPGQAFNYNSIEAALVGEIVSRATGKSVSQYLSEKVWQPAGMESYGFYILDGPPGIGKEFTAGGFNAVLRDYARVGQMILNKGKANGIQIVPVSWVEESTASGPGFDDEGLGYAYLWWTLEGSDAFTMLGGLGQYVFVDPESETVIVKLSHIPVGPDGNQASAEILTFFRAASAWEPK